MIRWLCIAVLVAGCFAGQAAAEEGGSPDAMDPGAMGPMGPPPEIEELGFLVGTWNVTMEMRMDPGAPWMTSTGTAKFHYVAGGAAVQMDYESDMMGMPFVGMSQTTFNRQTGEWTDTWIDNMGAYTSVYTGKMQDGKKVLEGKDYMMGNVWLTRATTWNITDTAFQWQMEHSTDDGKTWFVGMKAEYKKQVE